ncbi:MAG: class I SAM-dependent methyltransferase [Spirochaetia bacterium]|nr:class I SAM-dependent methyltransferase [Spirochaetia bacterium]
MATRVHEVEEYQDFLISEQRKGVVSPELYNNMISQSKPEMNILDFGCGLGYVSVFYSEKFKETDDVHIYACDYQVDVLDLLWKRIAENKFKKITPFFMSDQSRLHFPNWIPIADHIILSFSLSTTDNPVDILTTLQTKISGTTMIHLVEWDKNKKHEKIDVIYPERYRLTVEQTKDYLERTGYEILKDYKINGPYFAYTCRLKNPVSQVY